MKTMALLIMLCFFATSCHSDFLDIKSEKRLVVLSKIDEFQALMDRVSVMNQSSSHQLAILSIDDYYLSDDDWKSLTASTQRNSYLWMEEVFEGENVGDWNNAYQRIFYANVAIEGLKRLQPSEDDMKLWEAVMGRALFHRALNHFNLMQLFGEYTGGLDIDGLGIPLRKESDISVPITRATLKETYDFIINDLKQALLLLEPLPSNPERPSKMSVYMLLSKIMLYLRDYEKSWEYASHALTIDDELIDFNTLDLSNAMVFPIYAQGNPEVKFNTWIQLVASLGEERLRVDTTLVSLYDVDDLRRQAYFIFEDKNTIRFKGSYVGYAIPFTGLSTNELYTIAMEAAVRTNRLDQGLQLYNKLRKSRYRKDQYTEQEKVSADILLDLMKEEKRKELVMRASRWEDLKRYNFEGELITLERKMDGSSYFLHPNSPKYIFPIPDYVVEMSGIQQNSR